MNKLTTIDKQRLEDLFGMGSGYVLDFTNRSFAEFFRQELGVNIFDDRYAYNGSSKAKRLRAFWEIEDSQVVGRALEKLLEMWRYQNEPPQDERVERQYAECRKLTERLLGRGTKQESESDFLKRNFGAISLKGLDLESSIEATIEARLKEVTECMAAGASLSAIIMCGSILEGILLAVALKNPIDFNRALSRGGFKTLVV